MRQQERNSFVPFVADANICVHVLQRVFVISPQTLGTISHKCARDERKNFFAQIETCGRRPAEIPCVCTLGLARRSEVDPTTRPNARRTVRRFGFGAICRERRSST